MKTSVEILHEEQEITAQRVAGAGFAIKNVPKRGIINPFVDWSFKYLFGTERSKVNLIGFLNLMIMPDVPIVDVTYLNNEAPAVSQNLKGCVFDIICEDLRGEKYLIEMQNAPVDNIKERILYYTCRIIDRMSRRGSTWDYKDTCEDEPKLRRDVQLCDISDMSIFSDKLNKQLAL